MDNALKIARPCNTGMAQLFNEIRKKSGGKIL
jgi:hypothetical protein